MLALLQLVARELAAAQLGDLMLASIKRDTGVETLDNVIPGHGGVLDRFDSLILVAPVAYHGMSFFRGLNVNGAERIFTG